MSDTYARHADICAKFYALTTNSKAAGKFVFEKCRAVHGQRALFVGGMFGVASMLLSKGLTVTAIDYTDEMVEIGRAQMPSATVLKADLRALPFQEEFDLVLVVGRVFTHMIANADLVSAIEGCKRALRSGGKLFADNYEDIRIQSTNYFNGRVEGRDSSSNIIRDSRTTRISDDPLVVRWDAEYSGQFEGAEFNFSDSIEHRAFSRPEFADYLKASGLFVCEQGDNFDETSFYTISTRQTS